MAVVGLSDTSRTPEERLAAGFSAEVAAVVERQPIRELVTVSEPYPLLVERELAGRGAWYEFFPRSEGAVRNHETGEWTSGNFRTAAQRLDAVAAMGFDIIYMPPIHPIGVQHRKGPNNTLIAGPHDPGSPWAIGSKEGGHDAIHPDLGTFEDFDAFVARAGELGLEVALDLALQAAPDHPWVDRAPRMVHHPGGRQHRLRGEPAEEVPGHFPAEFRQRPRRAVQGNPADCAAWVSHGVKIFRVDNPHTKPVWFWEWLIGKVNKKHPDVVFLAEAFTRPAMMHALGRAGFQQSYTYFTWRNTKEELRGVLPGGQPRVAGLLPAELLRQHPGHPHRVPAVRRPGGVQDPCRAGRDGQPALGRVRRL